MINKKFMLLSLLIFLLSPFIISGCGYKFQSTNEEVPIPTETKNINSDIIQKTGTVEVSSTEKTIWIDPLFENSDKLSGFNFSGLEKIENKKEADYWIETTNNDGSETKIIYNDIIILSVPFTNQIKNLSYSELKSIWMGESKKYDNYWIWITPELETKLLNIFGVSQGASTISSTSKPDICDQSNCFHIANFNDANPLWRIIEVDNQSPLNPEFDKANYPLINRLYLNRNIEKSDFDSDLINFETQSNFNEELLTSVLMTGTTALVRNIAAQIEQNGYSFPLENLESIFSDVDIIHISNEVPFYSACPPAIPVRQEMRFCTDPAYIEVFHRMGVNVVELTGNHLLDWGPDAFLETLSLYESNDFEVYGGGKTPEEAKEPLLIENNGNKIAFLGCNLPGPDNNWVSGDRPGSLPCNLDELVESIIKLREEGFNPIFTFQHNEFNTFRATQQMRDDFWKMAKAGAVVVSGSQAHYPQGIDFVDQTFIHYGLGNFLFDQMYSYWGMATIDVHYFYDNQYINTRQLAIINENFGQPRLMNDEEAELLYEKIYLNSFYYLVDNQ